MVLHSISETTGIGFLMEMSNETMRLAVAAFPSMSLELTVRRMSVADMRRTVNSGLDNVYLQVSHLQLSANFSARDFSAVVSEFAVVSFDIFTSISTSF